jgi:pimeloyl-ACP methyl ester carboxylesterase
MATLEVGDATIWYDQMGSGRDLVWVPGGDQPGSDWHLDQVPHFAGRYRNTTFDPRGVGRTRAPAAGAISIADHAADVAAMIEALCDPPVVVIGLSMGSLVTQEMCLSYPELVRCGIAMGTSGSHEVSRFGTRRLLRCVTYGAVRPTRRRSASASCRSRRPPMPRSRWPTSAGSFLHC